MEQFVAQAWRKWCFVICWNWNGMSFNFYDAPSKLASSRGTEKPEQSPTTLKQERIRIVKIIKHSNSYILNTNPTF
jgi:hypothetical protein